ncbi:CGNR zinc finger domain-containing protein [Samsonia erythrinae]|uniref:Putative RNA-binding Zn ribbon-like protein n=1 Tax=Samsonia erythrinae TaxID=160434 RepID=A0A4R3VRJ4_9GAMM|nr:CGNR zinc finger domain-containing protein [Samsonia erythrinae]TCV07537.1 putative RNA-binding Zn ribbon-like protein [Samsonia erythrinae]
MSASHTPAPHFIANHLALDFINSAYGTGDEYHDFLVDDKSVVFWLKSAGQLPEHFAEIPSGLASQARALREAAIQMLNSGRTGSPCCPDRVNQLLDKGRPVKYLKWDDRQASFQLIEDRRDNSVDSLLEPIAASLARLLSGDELKYVRQCEAHDCTLMFLDTTKSHRRRWCSMALCGNRMKVAAFRSRKHEAG